MAVLMDITFLVIGSLFLITVQVHAQDKSDFISIDCGVQEDYTDATTNIHYSSDAKFINTGVSRNISTQFRSEDLNQRLANLRSFPNGSRNCYTLRPTQGKNNTYLIRAWFLHGNYDGENVKLPGFDLNIGTNLWDNVFVFNTSVYVVKEIMYVPPTDYIHVCLINTGDGTPFISTLELRHMNDPLYKTQSGSMVNYERLDLGSNLGFTGSTGYEYGDELGRLWSSVNNSDTVRVSTTIPIDSTNVSDYKLPLQIMRDAAKPLNESEPLVYYVDQGSIGTKFYVYLHFCEVETIEDNEVREFDILMNDIPWVTSVVPKYLRSTTVAKEVPVGGGTDGELWMSLVRTKRSTLPPILNALEVYLEKKLEQLSSNPEDVDAMVNISLTYGVNRNWQGDPCLPLNLSWSGLTCTTSNPNAPPQISSLNLSSSGLTGEIIPALASLQSIEHLDLSNNNLTGPVPEFLSQLPALKTLNLARNDLTGSVPKSLLEKSSLSLSTEDNPKLCSSLACGQTKKKKNIVAIVLPIVIAVAILSAIAIFWAVKMRRQKDNEVGRTLKSNNQRYSYSEVVRMTNNFEKVIGKGGFGTVYLGYLEDGTEVAVKMLSRSSNEVSEQFWTEAELLTTIHHRNLASLVGYSEEGSNTALIYEYMANGNLRECLTDKSKGALTWGQRLQIAIDSAQALEYLHNGCKPPIIHRDIKTDNILLTQNMQAKVADFGLSRIFPQVQGESHVSTAVVGTFGYLDPEYYITGRLTEKSDVYSFGIVLFELITGQPAIIKGEEDNTHIVQWVMPMLERGDLSTIVDPRLQGDYDNNSVWKALETAVACVPSSPIQRPTMNQVLGELKESQDMYLGTTGNTTETKEYSIGKASSSGINYSYSIDIESSMNIPRAR